MISQSVSFVDQGNITKCRDSYHKIIPCEPTCGIALYIGIYLIIGDVITTSIPPLPRVQLSSLRLSCNFCNQNHHHPTRGTLVRKSLQPWWYIVIVIHRYSATRLAKCSHKECMHIISIQWYKPSEHWFKIIAEEVEGWKRKGAELQTSFSFNVLS